MSAKLSKGYSSNKFHSCFTKMGIIYFKRLIFLLFKKRGLKNQVNRKILTVRCRQNLVKESYLSWNTVLTAWILKIIFFLHCIVCPQTFKSNHSSTCKFSKQPDKMFMQNLDWELSCRNYKISIAFGKQAMCKIQFSYRNISKVEKSYRIHLTLKAYLLIIYKNGLAVNPCIGKMFTIMM